MNNEVKCFIVEINKKVDGEWYKKSYAFYTVEKMIDYIKEKQLSRFTITVVRKKDAEEQGVLL